MALAVAAIITVLALMAVVYPLTRRTGRGRQASGDASALQGLLDQRETLFRAMAELEYDRKLGNLTVTEYERLRADYEVQAMGVLKALDQGAAGVDQQIEHEVAVYRTQKARASEGVRTRQADVDGVDAAAEPGQG
ncbi:MAG: hypothetical protein V3V35_08230 [Dehalococcoidia bacterium]